MIPSANPDGILDGWTNNGPGRTTVSAKKDINRSFPTNFLVYLDSRNYNGTTSLGSQEALALSEILLQWKSEASTMVLLDVHGWLNQSIGDSIVGQHYASQFGFSHTALGESARGYLTRWGQANGMLVSLIELPFPSSPQDIITRDFSGKFVQATRNMLNTIAQSIAVTGVTVSPTEVTLAVGQTRQLTATVFPTDATNRAVEWFSEENNIADVSSAGLVTAKAEGQAVITVMTEDGGFTDTTSVQVSDPLSSGFFKYPSDPDGDWTMSLAWNGVSTQGNYGHLANDMYSSHKKVKAIAQGTIYDSGWDDVNGNVIIVQHSIDNKTYYSFYAHLAEILVSEGQVTAGQQIGVMGGTPDVDEHLHLGIYVGTPFLDMYGYNRDAQGNKAYFDDNGSGFYDFRNIRFYDPQRVFSTDGTIISNNYPE